MMSSSSYRMLPTDYEAPFVVCCEVSVERGYSLTLQQGDIESLGKTKDEGYW